MRKIEKRIILFWDEFIFNLWKHSKDGRWKMNSFLYKHFHFFIFFNRLKHTPSSSFISLWPWNKNVSRAFWLKFFVCSKFNVVKILTKYFKNKFRIVVFISDLTDKVITGENKKWKNLKKICQHEVKWLWLNVLQSWLNLVILTKIPVRHRDFILSGSEKF